MAGLNATGGLGAQFESWLGLMNNQIEVGLALLVGLTLVLMRRNSNVLMSHASPSFAGAVVFGLLAAVSLMSLMASKYSEFIYFNF
jgi:hypothetical protein